MSGKHRDFEAEQQHLAKIIVEMKQLVAQLHSDIDVRLKRAQKSLLMKDEVSAYVHHMLRSDHCYRIHDIEAAIPSPYFGRVDFREDGTEQFMRFYIGRCKVARMEIQDDSDILVFDWRDPVATVFYECYEGRASYEVLGRYRYTGDVGMKRQYKIENSSLIGIVDNFVLDQILARQEEALLGDPLLAERLRQGATDKLRDIVTSIQAEQNKIIREPLNQVTVIQGVAGSGKSTIGLHRLSYLLYNEKLNRHKLIVIAPSRIFLDYISELLPQIDAADIRQMVWDDLVRNITRCELNIAEGQKLELILAGRDKAGIRLVEDAAQLKGSLDFMKVIHTYLEQKIQKFCLKLADIVLFEGAVTITAREQLDRFMEDIQMPYNERLRTLIRYITFKATNYVEVLETLQVRGKTSDERVKRCRRELNQFVGKYFKGWTSLNLMEAYRGIFTGKAVFKSVRDKRYDIDAVRRHTLDILDAGQVEREDMAPLACLAFLLDGWSHVDRYDHIVVDEAQDLNALEFAVLKRLSDNGSFTIMGDLSQGIHSYRSIGGWNVLLKEVFAADRAVYREILHSYRSAKEIVDVFNCVMPQGSTRAIPVYETGRKPTLEKILSAQEGIVRLIGRMTSFLELGAKSIGIITRRESDAADLHERLCPAAKAAAFSQPVHLVSGNAANYRGGVSVLPVVLAKGLEFDCVILWNASEYTADSLNTRLFYVALSRAMHGLHVMYQGTLTPLLQQHANTYFTRESGSPDHRRPGFDENGNPAGVFSSGGK